jgi:uncharacterized protein (TIGR04255 family)
MAYDLPPLLEANCEFRFDASSDWDLTMPGQIYAQLAGRLPEKEQAQSVDSSIGVGTGGVQQTLQTQERLKISSEPDGEVVLVGAHYVLVTKLRPYNTWDEYLPLILEAYEAYVGIAAPRGLHRMGLRYVNRLEIPANPAELEDFLDYYPFTGPGLPPAMDSFLVGATFPQGDSDSIKVQLASAYVVQPEISPVLLDLDYAMQVPGAVALDEVRDWLETAHERLEGIFEGIVKEPLRSTFSEQDRG